MQPESIMPEKTARAIADAHGTPTFVIREKVLKDNYARFCRAFTDNYHRVMVPYSVKTNYLPAILRILHANGAGMEVVSGFELYLALKIGVPPEKIIYNGPSKTMEELELAVENDILLINADSMNEVRRIQTVAARHGKKVNVGIRVNIESLTWKKFGIPLAHAPQVFQSARGLKNIQLSGLHAHIGTGIRNPGVYVATLKHLLELMVKLAESGIWINFLDIGGGFPAAGVGKWPDRDRFIDALSKRLIRKSRFRAFGRVMNWFKSTRPVFSNPPEIESYAQKICGALKEKVKDYALPEPALILEPGRAVVNNAVTLLVRVLDIKNFDEKWVMVDGGINLVPALEHAAYRVNNVSGRGAELETVTVAGPLCMESDVVCRSAQLPPVREGDILEVLDAGAYSMCRSMQFIRPRAGAVLLAENGEIHKVWHRENYEDLIRLDCPFGRESAPTVSREAAPAPFYQ